MKRRIISIASVIACIVCLDAQGIAKTKAEKRPRDFVDIDEVAPTVITDMRYFGERNFVGKRVDGYNAPKCILTKQAAHALAEVQKELEKSSMSLKVYDCYRPQKAVDHFARWAEDLKDTKTEREFYPKVDKARLFKDGYIAHKSGHSRGSTIDLSIVKLPSVTERAHKKNAGAVACYMPVSKRFHDGSLDMGTEYDCFSPLSNTADEKIGRQQHANRLILKEVMERHGFKNYDKEWWHYTLTDEPHPKTYFDFPVE